MKNFKLCRQMLACVLVLSMILGTCATAFAATADELLAKDTINYVSFGASNVNGYGLQGYLPDGITAANKHTANVYGYQRIPTGSYVDLVRSELGESRTNVDQLAISSMRVEELRYLLDDTYQGDAYTEWRFTGGPNWFNMAEPGGVPALRAAYRNAIENADLITVDIGVNNFGVYLSNQIQAGYYDDDLALVDPELADEYDKAKAYVYELLNEYASGSVAIVESLEPTIDAMAYALAGFCVNFDIVMEKIYELNPDATVVAVSIQNLMEGLVATFPGVSEEIPFGDLFGALVDTANLYIAVGSPYSDDYLFADVSENGRVEFFLDQLLAWDGDFATLDQDMIDCFVVYDESLDLIDNVNNFANAQLVDALLPYAGTLAAIYNETDQDALVAAILEDAENNFAIADPYPAASTLRAVFATIEALKAQLVTIGCEVITEIMQVGARNNVLDIATVFAGGYGSVEAVLGEAIMTELEAAANATMADPTYEYTVNEDFFEEVAANAGVPVELVNTIATLAIRTGVGNSFYGHPNRNGHAEIADAIMDAIENGTTGKEAVSEKIKALIEELNELIEVYGPEAVERVYDYLESEGYIAQLEAAITELETAIDEALIDLENPDSDLSQRIVAETDNLLAILEAKTGEELPSGEEVITAIRNYEDTLVAIEEYIANDEEIQAAIADAKSIIAQINDVIANPEDYIQKVVDDVVAKFEENLEAATSANYVACGENHYVAFAGTNTSGNEEYEYSFQVSDYIDAYDDSYHHFTEYVSLPDMVDYIKDMDSQAVESLKKATVITYQTDAKSIVLPVFDGAEVTADDWAALLDVDAEKAAEIKAIILALIKGEYADEATGAIDFAVDKVSEIKAKIMAELPAVVLDKAEEVKNDEKVDEIIEEVLTEAYKIANLGIDDSLDTVVDMVVPYAERLVFNTVAYLVNNIKAVEAIKAINPDALIAVVGLHNPVNGLMISVDGQVVDLGEYVDYFVEATNVYNTIYAAANENVIFVKADETAIAGYESVISIDTSNLDSIGRAFYGLLPDALEEGTVVTEVGHNYIANQLKAAITIVDHIDSNNDDLCDKCGANLAPVTPTPTPDPDPDPTPGPGSSGGGGVLNQFTVKFETNGGSAISSVTVKKNELLSAPAAPTKDGYVFDGWYTDKALTAKYDFSTPVTKSFTLYAKWVKVSAADKFVDLDKTAWYYEYVKTIIEKGLMNGISETQFAPDATLTRGMFVTILHRVEGEVATENAVAFADVAEGQWYTNAVKWASANGIVNGISETEFAPDAEVTREQMAAMIARYADYKKIEASVEGDVTYTDSDEVSEYAKDAVKTANKLGILIGNADGSFAPKKNATRAEAATLFVRLLGVLEK